MPELIQDAVNSPTIRSLRLDDINELFEAPAVDPLRGRFEARSVFEQLVDTVEPAHSGLEINIIVPSEGELPTEEQIERAIAGTVAAELGILKREMLRIRRLGYKELVFGLMFLAACLILSGTLESLVASPSWLVDFAGEGLVIVGWISLWHPVDMLFFECLPLLRKKRILENIGKARVHLEREQN